MAGNLGLNGGGQSRILGLNSNSNNHHNLNGLVNNHQLGGVTNSIDTLMGNANSAIGGVLGNHHNLRGAMAGGSGGGGIGVGGSSNSLGGLMGNMNVHHNARLNLAAAGVVAQQQQQNGNNNNMLGGLGMTGSFGGLFN